jgi:peptide/nickel transport system substrate-binding protein
MRRRGFLAGASTLGLAALAPWSVSARGRTPYGGQVALHVPWPLTSIDPHRIDDAGAAFFGDALFCPLFAPDDTGALVPSLTSGDPVVEAGSLRVRVRPELRFASAAPLDARAAATSIARARARDARAWLAEVPPPRVDGNDLIFAMNDADKLVRALASPLVAIVPSRFVPERPDSSGPFRVEPLQGGRLLLTRNPLAPSGPAFLDAVDARHAPDLATSLRAFESGTDDLGWLGSFLHEPRAGARSFDAGAVGWAILRTGRDAGALDAPGMAQALADGVPHAALAPFVVGQPWAQGSATWTGGPCELVVREDAPWLVELAQAVAAALSSRSHEVSARTVSASEFFTRRSNRSYALALDLARPAGPGAAGVLLGLATADDVLQAVALAHHPPHADIAPRIVTRTMRVGVVGEVRVQGGRAADLALPVSAWGRGVDWGSAFRSHT